MGYRLSLLKRNVSGFATLNRTHESDEFEEHIVKLPEALQRPSSKERATFMTPGLIVFTVPSIVIGIVVWAGAALASPLLGSVKTFFDLFSRHRLPQNDVTGLSKKINDLDEEKLNTLVHNIKKEKANPIQAER